MVLGKLPVPVSQFIMPPGQVAPRGVLLIWIIVGQGPTVFAVGAGGVVWTFFSHLSSLDLSPSLWETARYRLKYFSKGH